VNVEARDSLDDAVAAEINWQVSTEVGVPVHEGVELLQPVLRREDRQRAVTRQ
jgi:hypothetical protein